MSDSSQSSFTVTDERVAVKDQSCDMASQSSPKRPRRVYNADELDRLETVFASNSYPDRQYRNLLADEMKVSSKNIQIWFQNRRARERTIQRKEKGIIENPIERMRIHWRRGASPNGGTPSAPTTPQNENSFSSMSSSPSSPAAEYRIASANQVPPRAPLAELNLNRGDNRWKPAVDQEPSSVSRDRKRGIDELASGQFFRLPSIDGGSSSSRHFAMQPDTKYDETLVVTRRPTRVSTDSIFEISNSSFVDINVAFRSGDSDSAKHVLSPQTLALFSPAFDFVFDF